MNCLLCNRQLPLQLSWHQLLGWGSGHDETVCQECRHQFLPYPPPHCHGCGRTTEGMDLCLECQWWAQKLGWHLSHQCLFQYNEAMKDYMHRYKFQGDYLLRLVFSEMMTAQVKQMAADVVVPIPVSQFTWLSRGFNQVAGLVEWPLANVLAVIKRQKSPQSSRSRQERLAIQQPFCWVDEEARQKVSGKRVLLVDDVFTTGRTMYYGASLLRQAGVKSVKSLSLAG